MGLLRGNAKWINAGLQRGLEYIFRQKESSIESRGKEGGVGEPYFKEKNPKNL